MKNLINISANYLIRNIYKRSQFSRRILLLFIDIVLLLFALFFISKFESNFNPNLTYQSYLNLYFFLPFISGFIFLITGQYQGLMRYLGSRVFYAICLRNALAILIMNIFSFSLNQEVKSLFFSLNLIFLSTSFMTLVRLIQKDLLTNYLDKKNHNKEAILIYGVDTYSIQLADFLKNSANYYIPFFVDESPNLWGRYIEQIPIKSLDYLRNYKNKVKYLISSFDKVPQSEIANLITKLDRWGYSVRKIPKSENLIINNSSISDFTLPVPVEDFLSRKAVKPDIKLMKSNIKNKKILVTGAGGSIGSEICKQLLNWDPELLIIFDMSESNLYSLNEELSSNYCGNTKILTVLGNLLDKQLLEKLLKENSIDISYHSAAYKHVPLVEKNPLQGLSNNINSTKVICEIALSNKIKQVILISSDKAVRPTNVMGASKRVSELLVYHYAKKAEDLKIGKTPSTLFSMVRFGNVLCSSGSVIPLFQKQISNGGPLTLTHSEIIRYFMTIPEAAQLVISASAITKGGEIFLLDMGEPVSILNLAKRMINLNGLTVKDEKNPNGDIEIEIIGLRPGEKLFEELLIDQKSEKTIHPLIYKAEENSVIENFSQKLEELNKAILAQDISLTFKILKIIVPEWKKNPII